MSVTVSNCFNILVVDDNANNRFALRALLQRLNGCAVIEAASGQEALLRTFEHLIHLVLLDVQMPVMDGYETARHLAMIKRTRDIPVIFVTAVFKAEEFIRRGYALGAVDYLTKPIDDNLLLNRVESYRKLRERELHLAEALEQIKLREERLNYALEATQDGIWDWDLELGTMFLSSRFEAILGYAPGTFPDATNWIENTTHPDDIVAVSEILSNLKYGKQDLATVEYRARQRNETWIWLMLRAKVVQRKLDKQAQRIVGTSADISERINADNALKQAKLIAEAANRSKSVFLANMSHELKTPLNAILGFAKILEQDKNFDENQRNNLYIIAKSGQRLLTLINDVLEISRIEAGNLTVTSKPCDLYELLEALFREAIQRTKHCGLVFYQEIDPDLPRYVTIDVDKLHHVLIHLIHNAIKYTQQGNVTLRASGKVNMDSAHLIFTVSDTGIGINAPDVERVFLPFFQTENAIRQGEGIGLGLTVSREYAHLMGGSLTVESNPGQGSIFRLSVNTAITNASDFSDHPQHTILNNESKCFQENLAIIPAEANTNLNLMGVPQELCLALGMAVERLDMDEIITIIDRIDQIDSTLAANLKSMVSDFKFEQIIPLCS